MSVQSVKDSFYLALRDRVAAGDAGRTVVVRGTVRPAVLVVENELPAAAVDGIAAVECFCLRWTALAIHDGLARLGCEIQYGTDGSAGNAGMDRGRALAAMDALLSAALDTAPQNAAQLLLVEAQNQTGTTATGTQVFWSDVMFAPAVLRGERVERTATVEVYGYV